MEVQKTQEQTLTKKGMSTPDWIVAFLSGAYIISPLDFIPDAIPIVGWMDDFLVGIVGISTVINSQLSQGNKTL